jgi:hypothetical protein
MDSILLLAHESKNVQDMQDYCRGDHGRHSGNGQFRLEPRHTNCRRPDIAGAGSTRRHSRPDLGFNAVSQSAVELEAAGERVQVFRFPWVVRIDGQQ